ncbi:MAG: bacillithiol biosynthesis deacetylase BshB1 [candidate division Zixibacteria bacterium]|nr:bacillithiol biosynthesis deacetylase BshB1 [candidate division Zixibacteria bacterium]
MMDTGGYKMNIDLLSIGAHPDDVEVGTGGVLVKMKKMGFSTGILYLTQGEMGTGGTIGIRQEEAKEAAKILGVDVFETLDFGDCKLDDNYTTRLAVAGIIRKHKPRIILAPYWEGGHGKRQGHPDHLAAGRIAMNAANFATLKKMPIDLEPHRIKGMFHYFLPAEVPPTFVVDITDEFETWMAALQAHKSQFMNPEKDRDYMWTLESLARGFGNYIGVKYGQGFVIGEPMRIENLFCLVQTPGKYKGCTPKLIDDERQRIA